MTKRTYKKHLLKELNKLNENIDRKIMYGRGYGYEARRHKALLRQARALQRREWRHKVLSLFSSPYHVRKI